ncbi:succinylglutamate-semialdehyde dehydrogenase [Sandaracinobacteroides saxicola]|uniref:Succinylglutamate-semialdehyde dehydrogenase n=1 Tax=Sandaracinobacteroides saxicola TaxID=2759707 RepID=A0A7G5IJK7_9SPHN|nr:succinylglutamate-semialdehyde dehydrogenase [Sandaracinobacteroides saxicola]QMW23549.1 succinylglutamate-semialdehyde dehydrogenase [Sandaracinobacteroides saxicola]
MSSFNSFDPCTGETIWQGAIGDAAAVAAVVTRARAVQPAWWAAGLDTRIAVARAFKAAVEEQADAFARLISRETGKPLWETRTEVASTAAKVDISITALRERTGERSSAAGAATQALRHKPHGVLGVLGPYNFPVHLPNGHIVPALLAGNAVVLKPSELTPATADFMAALWAAAGLPPGVLTVIHGLADTGRALAGSDIDGLLFTGSAPTGSALARQFAETPHRILALEMGGNNPLLVWDLDPAHLDDAAATIVQSAYLSAGQRCTCARRLIIRDGAHAHLIDRVVSLMERLRIGEPFADPQPFMGPVIDNRAATRLMSAAATMPGTVIRPLTRPDPDRPFLTPALIDVTGTSQPDEEHFGPLLTVTRVADWDEAIAAANNTRFGLSAALLGGDRARYDDFWAKSRAGIVNWNRPTNGAASNAPFGGIGLSGNHRPSAYYAADYCAWPVASMESETPAATIGTGLI